MGIATLLVLAVLGSLPGAQQSSPALPPAPGAKVITLNRRAGSYTEPSIAVNPQMPGQILTAFQAPASVAYSNDSGDTWQSNSRNGSAKLQGVRRRFRSPIIWATPLLCYIAFDKLGTPEYWAHNATRNGVFIRRSLDGGRERGRPMPSLSMKKQPVRNAL